MNERATTDLKSVSNKAVGEMGKRLEASMLYNLPLGRAIRDRYAMGSERAYSGVQPCPISRSEATSIDAREWTYTHRT